jgi:hypothetical protein
MNCSILDPKRFEHLRIDIWIRAYLGNSQIPQSSVEQRRDYGEANFDINREDFSSDQMVFSLDAFRPTKVTAFESELERRLRSGQLRNEEGLLRFCLWSGFNRNTQRASSPD